MKPGMKRRPLADRFWEKVNKNGPVPPHRPELGPCWIWTASLDPQGYGRIGLGGHDGDMALAHRVSFLLEHGRWPQPGGLHHCDNPSCVRPEHLFEGDQAANAADMIAKGRGVTVGHLYPGERNGMAKLSDLQRFEIRSLRADGMPFQRIAAKFNVTKQAVMYVCKRGVA